MIKYSKFFTIATGHDHKICSKMFQNYAKMLKNTTCVVKCPKDGQKMLKLERICYASITILRLPSCCQGHNEHEVWATLQLISFHE